MCPEFGGKGYLFKQKKNETNPPGDSITGDSIKISPQIAFLEHLYRYDQIGDRLAADPLQTIEDIDLDPTLVSFGNEVRKKKLALTPEEKQRLFEVTCNRLKNKKPQPEKDSDISDIGEERRFRERLKKVKEKYNNGKYSEETEESKRLDFAQWLYEHGRISEDLT